jgi:hypothetical protein
LNNYRHGSLSEEMRGSLDSRGFYEYPNPLDPKMFDEREMSSDHYIAKIKAGQTLTPQNPTPSKKPANLNSRVNDFMTKTKPKPLLNPSQKHAPDIPLRKDLPPNHPPPTNLNPKIPNHYDFRPKVKYRTRASLSNPNPKGPQKYNQKIIPINS